MKDKLVLLAVLIGLSLFTQAEAQQIGAGPVQLVSNQAGIGAGPFVQILKSQTGNGAPKVAFQAIETGSGSVTATVTIEVSNDGINVVSTVACTISLTGTATVSDGCTTDFGWAFVRANVTAITGTTAKVSVWAN